MVHLHDVRDTDTHYKIDPITMAITNANEMKNKLMLGDHNSEIYTFEIPKVVEGHDMSLCDLVEVHFINISQSKIDKSEGVYRVTDLYVEGDTIVFSWKVDGKATKYPGSLNYRIKFACVDEDGNYTYRKWTEVYSGISVSDGFDNGEFVAVEYSDIISQWEARLDALEKNAIEQLYIGGYEDELPDGTWAYVYPIGRSELSDLAVDCGDSGRTVYIHFYAEGNVQHTRWFSDDWRNLDGFRYDDDLQAYVKVKSYGERITALEQNGGGDCTDCVKSVNGITPDENGNVEIPTGGSVEGAVAINQGTDKAGTLLYVGDDGNVTDILIGDGIEITHGVGKNIVYGEWCCGRYTADGFSEVATGVNFCSIDEKYPVTPGGAYTVSIVSAQTPSLNVYVWEFDENKNIIRENSDVKGDLVTKGYRNFTVTENTAFIGFFLYASHIPWQDIIPEGFMIEAGMKKTEYEPCRLAYRINAQKQIAESITDVAYAEHAPSATVRSIAHRGAAETTPECTAHAYILARKMGFTIAENDVQNTVDGKYVMWHDVTLGHCYTVYSLDGKTLMTDANGNKYWCLMGVAYTYDEATELYSATSVDISTLTYVRGDTLTITEQTYAFLRNIDVGRWKHAKYAGTQMLSFEEWIDLCKELGMECYIDNKTINTDEEAADLVAIARKKGMLRKCSWLGSMAQIRKADPKARCGILFAPTESNLAEGGTYANALESGGEGSVFWNPSAADVSAENAELAMSRGYGYECWYVQTSNVPTDTYYAEIERLLKCGCQGLTLDNHTVEHFTKYKYGNAMKN